MSIRPVDPRISPSPSLHTPSKTPSPPGSRFESFLQRILEDGRVDRREAVAAAELARLEQMRRVIDPYQRETGAEPPLPLPADPARQREKQAFDAYASISPPSPPTRNLPEQQPGEPSPPSDRTAGSLDDIIRRASETYQVDERLIRAVIRTESGYRVDAVSRAGAQGLMQLMPSTARSLGVTDPFDPAQNVMAGTRFLKDLLKRYDGNLDRALAAYNWGPANVDRHGMRLPAETRRYVARVKELATERG